MSPYLGGSKFVVIVIDDIIVSVVVDFELWARLARRDLSLKISRRVIYYLDIMFTKKE